MFQMTKGNEILAPAGEQQCANNPPLADQEFELRVTSSFLQALDHLAQTEGLSRSDIVRRAVGLYSLSRAVEAKGDHLAFVTQKDDDKLEVGQLIKL